MSRLTWGASRRSASRLNPFSAIIRAVITLDPGPGRPIGTVIISDFYLDQSTTKQLQGLLSPVMDKIQKSYALAEKRFLDCTLVLSRSSQASVIISLYRKMATQFSVPQPDPVPHSILAEKAEHEVCMPNQPVPVVGPITSYRAHFGIWVQLFD